MFHFFFGGNMKKKRRAINDITPRNLCCDKFCKPTLKKEGDFSSSLPFSRPVSSFTKHLPLWHSFFFSRSITIVERGYVLTT